MRLNGSVRAWLRAETQAQHEAVDRAFGAYALTERGEYLRFLNAHARALLPLEAALDAAGAGALISDWPLRRRDAALVADLHDLGAAPPSTSGAALDLRDEAAMWGAMYVLEGSRLGGRLLSRSVADAADPVVRRANRYLTHGAGEGAWRTFLNALEASPAVRSRPQETLAGASSAFAVFAHAAVETAPATF